MIIKIRQISRNSREFLLCVGSLVVLSNNSLIFILLLFVSFADSQYAFIFSDSTCYSPRWIIKRLSEFAEIEEAETNGNFVHISDIKVNQFSFRGHLSIVTQFVRTKSH